VDQYTQAVTFLLHREYDDAGNVTLEEVDQDGDGQWDERTARTWIGPGPTALVRTEQIDANGNGVFETSVTRTYDGDRLVEERVETDTDEDGIPDSERTTTYRSDGQVKGETEDRPIGGDIEQRTVYTYDGNGNLTKVVWEYADGKDTTTYKYDCF
jgi:hypothetical protein